MTLQSSLDLKAAPAETTADAQHASRLSLTLGHVLTGMGAAYDEPIRVEDIHVIRHSFRPGGHDEMQAPEDLNDPAKLLAYTRSQKFSARSFPADPPKYWVILIADGGRRSRLFGTFKNYGEVLVERTDVYRYFDLRPSSFLEPLAGRLVVEWGKDTVRWNRSAVSATNFAVLEIADRDKVPFPGFDGVLLTYPELREMVEDHRYADWRAALKEVQGIYLITDSKNGKQYVGKADGTERILGRWTDYARDGHGGNIDLRELAGASAAGESSKGTTDHARHFVFSLLRVFGPSTPSSEVDHAESHYKRALMTREFGLNRN